MMKDMCKDFQSICLFVLCLFFTACIPEDIELPVASAPAEAIDLGLSVKWASYNVGANSPEEYGGYFAWGETKIKSNYAESTSLTYGLSESELKSLGIIGSDGNLTAAYDAATVNWGSAWRMPTLDEVKELLDKCSWQWTTVNGIYGQKVTGPNGNSIFLPAAGRRYGTEVGSYRGSSGYYWSGTQDESYSVSAYVLYFYRDNLIHIDGLEGNDFYYRNRGFSVRPVTEAISVTTGTATDITASGATLSGSIANATQSLTCGVIYGTSSTLSSSEGLLESTTSKDEYSIAISGLEANTTYYYRAYAVDAGKYRYGEIRSFTTNAAISVTTCAATNITANAATLSGSITNATQPLTCGFIYGTSSTLSPTSGTMVSTISDGDFSYSLTGLNDNTTYYYRAYGNYKYGEVRSFTTKQIDESAVAEAVDLGLSVKWASHNVGATAPEEYGGYYAWGETKIKPSYTEDNSVTYGLSTSKLQSQGIIGSDGNLTAAYDVAHVKWGGGWRMPTTDEIKELRDKCSGQWTTVNGVNGYKVTGSNGNSIFLPAEGYRKDTEVSAVGSYGYIWSSTPPNWGDDFACYLYFDSGAWNLTCSNRHSGISVRPVTGEGEVAISVTTGTATDITASGATLSGSIANATQPMTCGIIYGTSSTLSFTNGTIVSTTSDGDFSLKLTELSENTTYYYRAYVVVDGKYKYGETESFETILCNDTNHIHAIDLGLSVKWASHNVGAESPEEYGGYYAWGETEEKSNYDFNTYKYYLGDLDGDWWISESDFQNIGLDISGTSYDVAYVKWGGSWRMPTLDETKELFTKCSWKSTSVNGVNGYKITGSNGNSIFLPAAGRRYGTEVEYRGSYCIYWSGTLVEDYSDNAYALLFSSGGSSWDSWSSRYIGHTVRPVTE